MLSQLESDIAPETKKRKVLTKDEEIKYLKRKIELMVKDQINQEGKLQDKVNEMLAMEKKRKEEYERERICYLCQNQLEYPLQLCLEGHCACAKCLAAQIQRCQLKAELHVVDAVPTISIVRDCAIKCGNCQEVNIPQYPGSFFVGLIVDKETKNDGCSFCGRKMPLSELGKHMLSCDHQILECVCCKEKISEHLLQHHIDNICTQIPCNKCFSKMAARDLKQHKDNHKRVKKMHKLLTKMSDSKSAWTNVAMQNIDQFEAAVILLAADMWDSNDEKEDSISDDEVLSEEFSDSDGEEDSEEESNSQPQAPLPENAIPEN